MRLTWGLQPHPRAQEDQPSSVSTWAVLEERWSSACPQPYLCLPQSPLSCTSACRLPSWLGLSLLQLLWTCLVFTGPGQNPGLWIDFPAWSRNCLNTMIPPCDPESWLDLATISGSVLPTLLRCVWAELCHVVLLLSEERHWSQDITYFNCLSLRTCKQAYFTTSSSYRNSTAGFSLCMSPRSQKQVCFKRLYFYLRVFL